MKLIQVLEAFRDAFAAEAACCAKVQDHAKHAQFTALAKQAHDAAANLFTDGVTLGAPFESELEHYERRKQKRMIYDEGGSDFVPQGYKLAPQFYRSAQGGERLSDAVSWARNVALPALENACAHFGRTEAPNPRNANRRAVEKLEKKLRETDAKWRALNKKHQRTVEKLKREQAGKMAALDCLRSSEAEARELRQQLLWATAENERMRAEFGVQFFEKIFGREEGGAA